MTQSSFLLSKSLKRVIPGCVRPVAHSIAHCRSTQKRLEVADPTQKSFPGGILDPSWCWAWHNLHMLSLDSQKDFTCDQQLGKYLNKLLALRSAKKLLSI